MLMSHGSANFGYSAALAVIACGWHRDAEARRDYLESVLEGGMNDPDDLKRCHLALVLIPEEAAPQFRDDCAPL